MRQEATLGILLIPRPMGSASGRPRRLESSEPPKYKGLDEGKYYRTAAAMELEVS